MAKIGEAYVELSARLDRLKTDMDQGQMVVSNSVRNMIDQANRLNSGFEPATKSIVEMRMASGTLAMLLGASGVQSRFLYLGLLMASRAGGTFSASMAAASASLKAFLVGIGEVGVAILTFAVVAEATSRFWDWQDKKIKAAEDAWEKFDNTLMKGIQNQVDIQRTMETRIRDIRSDDRQQELNAVYDFWIKLYNQTEQGSAQQLQIIAGYGEEIAAKRKEYYDEDLEDQRQAQEEARKQFEQQAIKMGKMAASLSSAIMIYYAQTTGQENLAARLQKQEELQRFAEGLQEVENYLRQTGRLTDENVKKLDMLNQALKIAGETEQQRDRQRLTTVQAGYGETAESLRRISVSPEFTTNVTGAAQENTARGMLGQLIRIGDAVTGKQVPLAAGSTWQ